MSRSFKKVPICGITTSPSEKQDKRLANRALRHAAKMCIGHTITTDNYDAMMLPLLREVSNVWGFAKDGRQYVTNPDCITKVLRK